MIELRLDIIIAIEIYFAYEDNIFWIVLLICFFLFSYSFFDELQAARNHRLSKYRRDQTFICAVCNSFSTRTYIFEEMF